MNQVPKIISTKDLSYLEDMFKWNFNVSKTAHHFYNEVTDNDVKNKLDECAATHSNICKKIVNILKGGNNE